MASTIPGPRTPALDPDGTFNNNWLAFFQGLIGSAAQITNTPCSTNPFAWTASATGNVVFQNGTVTGLSLSRGKPGARTTVQFGASRGPVPVAPGDLVTVSGSSLTLAFIPS